jgi:predicted O-linked N-acetylglucosamine transferase (SPINDLY family)
MRGRVTYALYTKMGFTELIAHSPAHYIRTAVRLATDTDFNRQVRDRIRDTNSVLFEDRGELSGLEEFLSSLSNHGGLFSGNAAS